MATQGVGFSVLPQYQGNLYDIQTKQALAQALLQKGMSGNLEAYRPAGGGFQYVPQYGVGGVLAQALQGYAGANMQRQANQEMTQLGQMQSDWWNQQMGGGAPASAPQQQNDVIPQDQPQTPLSYGMGAGGGFTQGGPDAHATMLANALQPQQAPQSAPPQGGSSPMNPLGLPPGLAGMMAQQNFPEYAKNFIAPAYKPAEIISQLRAAGIDPNSALGRQVSQQVLTKAIAPDYESLRPGGYALNKSTGQIQQMPHVPDGFTAQQDQNGQWRIVPVDGGLNAMSAAAAANAGGRAQFETKEVWDPTANGGQGGMVQQTVANVANAANGGAPNAPLGIRNNNPGNLRPGGSFAQYPDMQAGITALDNNLQSYAKQGINTLAGVISKWAPPSENNTAAYIKTAAARLGIDPNQKIDLSNPLVRQAVSTAIALHENGPQGVFGAGGSAPGQQGGAMASQPPLGTATAANASQAAPSKQMADSYGAMSTADGSYQQSREALQEMIGLANQKGAGGAAIGVLPAGVSTRISPDAAKYQKLHATYVALQGKALGSGSTDAARATLNEAVPTYDKPQSAMVSGLQTQLNNLDLSHLKAQFLTPLYQQGNEKGYTAQSAAFDQNIKPTMINALQLSGDAQRAAVQAAVKANPSLRKNFEWAYNNGMLK